MNLKKIFEWLFAKIGDHLVQLGLGLITITAIVAFYNQIINYAVPFFQWYWTPWIILAAVLIGISFRYILKKVKKGKRDRQVKLPKYAASFDQRFVDREYAKVIWKVMAVSDAGPAMSKEITEESVRVWVKKDPYCPECDFELERTGKKWHCIPCAQNYLIPKNLRNDTWVKMTKIFQRYIIRLSGRNWMVGEKPQIPWRKYLKDSEKTD